MNGREDTLILVVDDDRLLSRAIASVLVTAGYETVCAGDGQEAIRILEERRPKLVIVDIRMPVMDGIQFLVEARKRDTLTPVIMTTGHPDLDTAIEAMHHGAFDYLTKPFQPEMLLQKVRQALTTSKLAKENIVLSRLASLHEIATCLASTHDLDELLDVTLDSCLRILDVQGGSIRLVDKERGDLVIVRQRGIDSPILRSSLDDEGQWAVPKWVVKNGRSLLIADGRTTPPADLRLDPEDSASAVVVPLKVADEVIGVVCLSRDQDCHSLTVVDLNTMDVFASQAGIAISNAKLYSSLNQKIDELSLISSYSEDLMARLDRNDVVRCLFETVHQHFPIDVIGFLMIRRRYHEFLVWSRGELDEKEMERVCTLTIDEYNKTSKTRIQRKRVTIHHSPPSAGPSARLATPLAFNRVVAVVLEDLNFGAVYFGAMHEPKNRDDVLSLLVGLVNQTRIALTNTKLYDDVKENYIRTIKALAIAVDAKDTYTHGHSENVMKIAEAIATEMRLDEKAVGAIRDAGLLHDIGKIGIPGYILNKPGPLTYEEFNGVMKTHANLGANIVKDVPFLHHLYSLILSHHEHYDGTGYPEGRRGQEIPLGSRILHVADAFEAMTSNRPYRSSLGRKEALRRLQEEKGKQFDPTVVEAFMRVAATKGWIE